MCEWVRAVMSRRENMLIAFMINAKLQKHRILHNEPPHLLCLHKETVEMLKENCPTSRKRHASCPLQVHTHMLARTLCVGVSFSVCVCVPGWFCLRESSHSPLAGPLCVLFQLNPWLGNPAVTSRCFLIGPRLWTWRPGRKIGGGAATRGYPS